jgi:hypothetical protein
MSRAHLTPTEQRQAKLQRQHQQNLRRLAEQKQKQSPRIVRTEEKEEEAKDG